MSNVLTISNAKENILEFSLEAEGINTASIEVNFVIKTKAVKLAFPCKKGDNNTWSVTIPALSILEKTMYDFEITAVTDGYYFVPLNGQVDVVPTHELFVSAPTNKTLASTTEKPEAKAEEKKVIVKAEKEEEKKEDTKKVDEKKLPLFKSMVSPITETVEQQSIDRTVQDILKETAAKKIVTTTIPVRKKDVRIH